MKQSWKKDTWDASLEQKEVRRADKQKENSSWKLSAEIM